MTQLRIILFLLFSLLAHISFAQENKAAQLFGAIDSNHKALTKGPIQSTYYKSADTTSVYMIDTGGLLIPITLGNGIIRTGNKLLVDSSKFITTSVTVSSINGLQHALDSNVKKKDTATMLLPYLRKIDTTAMLSPYLRSIDTTSKWLHWSDTIGRLATDYDVSTKFNILDTTGKWFPANACIVVNSNQVDIGCGNYSVNNSINLGTNILDSTTQNVLIGKNITVNSGAQNFGHTVIGHNANPFGTTGFGTVLIGNSATSVSTGQSASISGTTLVGSQCYGSGTAIGYKDTAMLYQNAIVGPLNAATGLLGNGPVSILGNRCKSRPSLTNAGNGVVGCHVMVGDVLWEQGYINYLTGGGVGIGHNYVAGFACSGINTNYQVDISNNDKQGYFGWFDVDGGIDYTLDKGFINDWWIGGPDSGSYLHAITLSVPSRFNVANTAGVDWTFRGSRGTGNATPGNILFQTSDATASGSTMQLWSTKLSINSTNVTTAVVDEYTSDLSGSYTNRSKIDKGYAASTYQPLDADLTTIAGLTATTDNFLVSVASAWASRTPTQVKTTLSLNNVENTALSTWAGSTNLTTLGTIGTGTWQGGIVSSTYGGTGVNNGGRTLTLNTNSGTLAFSAASKTATFAKSLTFDGTDATTLTFPSTSATIARTDAGQTFTGANTFFNTSTTVGDGFKIQVGNSATKGLQVGYYNTNQTGIWGMGVTPSTSNYAFLVRNDGTSTQFNGISSVLFNINDVSQISCASTGSTFSNGIGNNGSGLKHARITTGSVSGGSTALVTVTWGTAFADANYTVEASVLDATTTSLSLSVVHIESISASAVTVRILNNSVGSLTGTLHVIAMHD
jgi:hypothetical protein